MACLRCGIEKTVNVHCIANDRGEMAMISNMIDTGRNCRIEARASGVPGQGIYCGETIS